MFDCLYCGEPKDSKESSLEHAVPQFLGGAAAPTRFHLKNVCAQCNSRLGLFVDASYAKSWFVTNSLAEAARLLCTSENDPGLPLTYLGYAQIAGLAVPAGFIAEHWIGPFGETIIWVRSHDDRMEWYAGGNPIDAKRTPSTVYFVPTQPNAPQLTMGLNSLDRMFKKKNVRTLLCAKAVDNQGLVTEDAIPGFDLPTDDEKKAIEAILAQVRSESMHARAAMHVEFDLRFICKLALGVGYGLFGEAFLQQPTTADLRRGVWPRQAEPKPPVRGVSSLSNPSREVAGMLTYRGTVVLLVIRTGDHWSLTLTASPELTFTVAIGPSTLSAADVNADEGYALVLVPYLEKAIELTGAALFAHRLGTLVHPELETIDCRKRDAEAFWKQVG